MRDSIQRIARHTLAWVFLFFLHFAAVAQSSNGYMRYLVQDAGTMLTEPMRWKQGDWAACFGITAGTFIALQFDQTVHELCEDVRKRSVVQASGYIIEPLGNGLYSLPILAGLGAYGILKNNPFHAQVAGAGLEAFIFAAGGATCSKWLLQRHRPSDDVPADPFVVEGPFGDLGDDGSFVSRHAASSFAIATVLASAYGKQKKWVPWVAYGLASAVTVSRVYNGKHWSSDAFAGVAFGVVTGRLVYRLHADRHRWKTF